LEVLRRQLACAAVSSDPRHEKRYPCLDRDLLEFLYAIPREQLVRPNQRRSLMRRALVDIVPNEVLNRKRKAFPTRGPVAALSEHWLRLGRLADHMVSDALGIVNPHALTEALQRACAGQEISTVSLTRTLAVEGWLRHIWDRDLLRGPTVDSAQGLVIGSKIEPMANPRRWLTMGKMPSERGPNT